MRGARGGMMTNPSYPNWDSHGISFGVNIENRREGWGIAGDSRDFERMQR